MPLIESTPISCGVARPSLAVGSRSFRTHVSIGSPCRFDSNKSRFWLGSSITELPSRVYHTHYLGQPR